MKVSPHTQAILLLTTYFNKASNSKEKPLTPREWGKFALWLNQNELTPESLLTGNIDEQLLNWSDSKVTKNRIEYLLNRGSALAFSLEKWLRAGLWVITRADEDYPKRLKKHLKYDSPAVLFGCGNRALLNKGGIAAVGSRNTSNEDLSYSRGLGEKAAKEGYSIISGGARGIDETAMLGALEAEGTVVGVMADSLLKASSSAKYRKYLMNNNLVLISSFYPEAGFNVGNAMQRNKYIYSLSDAAIAVHSGQKGGTWNGVIENLNKIHVPMWIKETKDPDAGNAELVRKGGAWLSSDINEVIFSHLFKSPIEMRSEGMRDLFESYVISKKDYKVSEYVPNSYMDENSLSEKNKETQEIENQDRYASLDTSFYQLFLNKVELLCKKEAQSADYLVERIEINKSQVNVWLKRAVSENKLKKINRPVRYEWLGESNS